MISELFVEIERLKALNSELLAMLEWIVETTQDERCVSCGYRDGRHKECDLIALIDKAKEKP